MHVTISSNSIPTPSPGDELRPAVANYRTTKG
jgi:hypothetical protein